jgi:hypothetical protein
MTKPGKGAGLSVGPKASWAGELLKPRGRLGLLGQHERKEERGGLGRDNGFRAKNGKREFDSRL